jgi:hypothetical protein
MALGNPSGPVICGVGSDGGIYPLAMDKDTGMLLVQLATSPTIEIGDVTLLAGAAIVGKVGIDQTAPGTTNGVQVNAALPGGEAHVGQVGQTAAVIAASATLVRPADTTAYASGDLVANSVTAGSVAARSFTTAARISGGNGKVVGAKIQKSTNSVTNAAFRLHLFTVVPTFASNGDNDPISGNVVASAKGYIGYIDIAAMTGFSDVAWGFGTGSLPFVAVAQTLFGVVEARGAYTPGDSEVFTISLMVEQN